MKLVFPRETPDHLRQKAQMLPCVPKESFKLHYTEEDNPVYHRVCPAQAAQSASRIQVSLRTAHLADKPNSSRQ